MMNQMAEYDCERLPPPRYVPHYGTVEGDTWDPFNSRWHDGRPSVCRYPDCVLIHGRYRDGRPPRQCPIGTFHCTTCKYVEAQKEWRRQRREKRRMARLDRFLRDQEPLADLARPGPSLSDEKHVKSRGGAEYRDGKLVAIAWGVEGAYGGVPANFLEEDA